MKAIYKIILAICGAAAFTVSAEAVSIAVMDLQALGVDSASALIVSDRLRNELFKTGIFTVVERKQMKAILDEQGFQESTCSSDACMVMSGKLLGVQSMVYGTIGKLGRTYTISARLIEVGSGRITRTASTDCQCEIDDILSRSTLAIARQLAELPAAEPPVAKTPGKAPKLLPAEAPERAPRAMVPPPVKKVDCSWQNHRGLKTTFLSAFAVGLFAGIAMNASAQSDIDESRKIRDEYIQSQTNIAYDALKVRYNEKVNSAENKVLLRNVAYGLAAAGAVGFGVTFTF
ncbi:MAG: CsgG/HfaB family protein [Fibrobacterota bacterium]